MQRVRARVRGESSSCVHPLRLSCANRTCYILSQCFPPKNTFSVETLVRSRVAHYEKIHIRLGNVRLLLLSLAVIMAWASFRGHSFSPWWLAAPVAAFVGIAVYHSRILRARELARACRRVLRKRTGPRRRSLGRIRRNRRPLRRSASRIRRRSRPVRQGQLISASVDRAHAHGRRHAGSVAALSRHGGRDPRAPCRGERIARSSSICARIWRCWAKMLAWACIPKRC